MQRPSNMIPIPFCPPLRAWHYDARRETLAVELPASVFRLYSGVTARIFERLIDATIPGGGFAMIERLPHRPLFGDSSETEESGGVGSRFVEMQLARDFGESGTIRRRYEELQRHLDTLPIVNLEAELERVRGLLAQVNPSSEVAEVAGLMLEETALLRIISTAEPARAELQAEIDDLRVAYQSGAQERFRRDGQQHARILAGYARLAELNKLIDNPPTLDPVEKGKHYLHMSLAEAQKVRLKDWWDERSQWRAQFGLPDEEQESEKRGATA